jgi:tetratricopeptide (TPR) repeat protein
MPQDSIPQSQPSSDAVILSPGALPTERRPTLSAAEGISVCTNTFRKPNRIGVALCAGVLTITAAAQSPKELISAGRTDDAIQSLQQQIAGSAANAETHNLLCRAYFQLEEWDHAISSCERAITLEPKNSSYHLWLGRAFGEKADKAGFLSAAGLAKRVRTEFERAVELDPKSWEARTDLAEFYVEAPGMVGGGKDKAQAQADALAPLKPAMQHYIQGRIAEKNNKDKVAAEREYKAAIEASQGGAHAWLNLALFYRHTNRLDEMDKAVHTMETRPMDRPESLMDGASILFRANRQLPFASEILKRYLKFPVEAEPAFKAHYLLGQIYEKQGDRTSAIAEYRAAQALAHNYPRAQDALKRLEH